ncbi:hypothetical protein EJ04DRAFT_48839 [Polyplosphaeria fusca]|uniref:Uncharacterized protein n=1 Tax=Polyplosphaeria fusca TaxID=682080 RepID=A0A9P4UZI7_9PLEO|nr:hypothetical protein EJ04DRAFT_48839 [Polyplosphaeria fusca]
MPIHFSSFMLSFFTILLCSLHCASALSLDRSQQPLLSTTQRVPNHAAAVLLDIVEAEAENERYVELPLRERVLSGAPSATRMWISQCAVLTWEAGAQLPRLPKYVRIVGLLDTQRQSSSLDQLSRTICRVYPAFSREEQATFRSMGEPDLSWPWFTVEDGAVLFQETSSRWFLAGREIESYECR